MEAFLDDPARAVEMGLRLQKRVRTVFLWDEAYSQYRQIILQAYEKRREFVA